MEKYLTHVVYNVEPETLKYFKSIPEKYAVLTFAAASGTFYKFQILSTFETKEAAQAAADRLFRSFRRVTVWKKEGEKITNQNEHEMKGLSIYKIR